MALFGKKKIEEEAPTPAMMGTPTDLVMQMRQQGLSDNQIVQSLQKEGFTSTQIFDALSQADIKNTIQPMHQEQPVQQMPQPIPQQQIPEQQPMPQPMQQMPQQAQPQMGRDRIEEVAEAIIDEKWEELMKGVNKIVSWKEETEEKLTKMHDDLEDLKQRFSELHTGVLGKISEYDRGIRDVGTDVKAMQEVFKKALPKFTENVAALERISKKKSK